MPDQTYRQVLKKFFRQLSRRRKLQLVGLLGLMLIGAVAELVTIGAVVPFISLLARPEAAAELPLLGELFHAIGWQDSQKLGLPMALTFLLIVMIATGVRLLLAYASNRVIFGIGHDISVKLYSTILDQPYAYHIQRNSSEVVAAVTKAQLLLGTLLRPLMQGLTSIAVGLGILAALLLVDAGTALAAGLVFGVLYFAIIGLFRRRLRANSVTISKSQDERIKSVQEGLGGIRDVILEAHQPHYTAIFSKADQRLRNAQATNSFLGQAPRYIVEMIGIGLIVVLALALSQRPEGLLAALPVLGALALGAARLLPLIQQIYQAWASFSGNFGGMEDVLGLLDLPRQSKARDTMDQLPFEQTIEFRDLRFRYSKDQPEVLKGIHLTIQKGTRVGIIGKTGSGKSTFTDLLMGLLEPSGGQVLVDGHALDVLTRKRWQRRISHVPQHIYLSDASIAENIALGLPLSSIDDSQMEKAARLAQVAEFIESHREGYRTRVGERGVQLSGGQRQRIGIARALYKNADVLVFDEASSALDMKTETAVMEAVASLSRELTIFIIAHRVQTLEACDVVLSLDAGRIESVGTYQEMIQKSSGYSPAHTTVLSTD